LAIHELDETDVGRFSFVGQDQVLAVSIALVHLQTVPVLLDTLYSTVINIRGSPDPSTPNIAGE
jgi:hypothetical protein